MSRSAAHPREYPAKAAFARALVRADEENQLRRHQEYEERRRKRGGRESSIPRGKAAENLPHPHPSATRAAEPETKARRGDGKNRRRDRRMRSRSRTLGTLKPAPTREETPRVADKDDQGGARGPFPVEQQPPTTNLGTPPHEQGLILVDDRPITPGRSLGLLSQPPVSPHYQRYYGAMAHPEERRTREVDPFQGAAAAAHNEPVQETPYSVPVPQRRSQIVTPAEVQALGRTHGLNMLLKPLTRQEDLREAVHLLVPRGEGRRMGMFSLTRRELLAAGLEGRLRPVIVGGSWVSRTAALPGVRPGGEKGTPRLHHDGTSCCSGGRGPILCSFHLDEQMDCRLRLTARMAKLLFWVLLVCTLLSNARAEGAVPERAPAGEIPMSVQTPTEEALERSYKRKLPRCPRPPE